MRRNGLGMTKVSLVFAALACLIASAVQADERDVYLRCVTDDLSRGTDVSDIGNVCLGQIGPTEDGGREDQQSEEYPYEERLRDDLVTQGSLFDPESAQFKDLVHSRNIDAWCGQVNAKNRLGGYVGWQYFALRDRYRGHGKRSEFIDFQIGEKAAIEKTCKAYRAWVRTNW